MNKKKEKYVDVSVLHLLILIYNEFIKYKYVIANE